MYHHTNVSLNSRLHSGVLSSSALRPTLYVATNTKFVDFGASLGAARCVLQQLSVGLECLTFQAWLAACWFFLQQRCCSNHCHQLPAHHAHPVF